MYSKRLIIIKQKNRNNITKDIWMLSALGFNFKQSTLGQSFLQVDVQILMDN